MFIAVLNIIWLDPVRCFWQQANNYKQQERGVDVYFSLAKKSEDITDTVLAVRGSLQDVSDALDDFIRGAEVLAVSPGLWNNSLTQGWQ